LAASEARAKDSMVGILPFLKKEDKVLDFGCGTCSIWKYLADRGYNLTGVDINNLSLYQKYQPEIIQEGRLPYEDNQFDVAIIYTVLHHTKDPKSVLLEVKRVAKRLIVVEETYKNSFQKYLTFIMDSLTNWEFLGHPHTNKTEQEWTNLFTEIGLKIDETRKKTYWLFFDSTSFYLEKINSRVQK
jgi:ubiquinone/menaquinone biosynthesis C-methylase UbiE